MFDKTHITITTRSEYIEGTIIDQHKNRLKLIQPKAVCDFTQMHAMCVSLAPHLSNYLNIDGSITVYEQVYGNGCLRKAIKFLDYLASLNRPTTTVVPINLYTTLKQLLHLRSRCLSDYTTDRSISYDITQKLGNRYVTLEGRNRDFTHKDTVYRLRLDDETVDGGISDRYLAGVLTRTRRDQRFGDGTLIPK